MKSGFCACLFVLTLSLWANPWAARAEDLVEISGVVKAGTCALHPDDEQKEIEMPKLNEKDVSDVVAGPVPDSERTFVLRLTHCVGVAEATLSFSGDSAPGHPRLYLNNGSAQGVALQLLDAVNDTELPATGGSGTIAVTGTDGTYSVKARYFRLDGVGVVRGDVASAAVVNVSYQ
jgi:type 1 fimbria pilin